MYFEFSDLFDFPFIKFITPKTLIGANILSVTQVIITYYNINITNLCKQCKKVKSALYADESAHHADFEPIFACFLLNLGCFFIKKANFHKILHRVQIFDKKRHGRIRKSPCFI